MPEYHTKSLTFDWREVVAAEVDWERNPRDLAFQLLQICTIRRFEEAVLQLKGRGLVHGPVHSSIGQEAVAVGAAAAMGPGDLIVSTHRAHHHFLARAMAGASPAGFDPLASDLPGDLQEVVNRTMAEIMGLAPGWCGGRGGSMHLHAPELGVLGTSAIVAGGVALATGAAWAQKYLSTGNIVVVFLGDGAVNQGVFHEAVNLGALWEAPIIYLIENNGYAVATGTAEAAHVHGGLLSQRAAAYDLAARVVDGMNPVAMAAAVEEAAAALRRGAHPFIIEALTYRYFHHAGDLPGSGFGYRSKAEEETWRARDPVQNFGRQLLERNILSEDEDRRLRAAAEELVSEAVRFCTVDGKEARSALQPDPCSVSDGLRSDGSEFEGIEFAAAEPEGPTREISYVEAIAAVTGRRMEDDARVFVLGEEVGHMGGGAYRAMRGLARRFPGRVLDTPISEAGFSGLAGGAALVGLRPVVEIMFPDFALVAADQLLNHIGQLRHMYGGKAGIPIVVRTRVAIGCGYGGQHSSDPAALFALFPGWRIIAPTTPYDYIGLFNAAIRCDDPVLVVEHHSLYERTGPAPKNDLDYALPLDRAKVIQSGRRVTTLAYGGMLARIEELVRGDDTVELIDLRALDLAHVDYETIGESVRKTGAIVFADESTRSNSIGAVIAHECESRFFDELDGPVLRITGGDVPKPVSRVLEQAAIPSDETIISTLDRAARRDG